MRNGIQGRFRSNPYLAFIVKVWGPCLLLWVAIQIGFSPIAVLLTICAFFLISTPQVRPERNALYFRYFYFMKWNEIFYPAIVDCKTSLVPAMGVLKLHQYVPPWGKMYFVLEGPGIEIVWPGGQSVLTSLINEYRQERISSSESCPIGSAATSGQITCFFLAALGTIYGIFAPALFPIANTSERDALPIMNAWKILHNVLLTWPWNLVILLLLAVIIRLLGFSKKAWIFAFLFGTFFGATVIHLFSGS